MVDGAAGGVGEVHDAAHARQFGTVAAEQRCAGAAQDVCGGGDGTLVRAYNLVQRYVDESNGWRQERYRRFGEVQNRLQTPRFAFLSLGTGNGFSNSYMCGQVAKAGMGLDGLLGGAGVGVTSPSQSPVPLTVPGAASSALPSAGVLMVTTAGAFTVKVELACAVLPVPSVAVACAAGTCRWAFR